MNTNRTTRFSWGGAIAAVLLAFVSSTLAQPRLFLAPQGDDPQAYPSGATQIELHRGESVRFDIWVQDTAVPLRGYVILLDSADGGDEGSVSHVVGTATVDPSRPDYIYPGVTCTCVWGGCVEYGPPVRFAGATLFASDAPIVTEPKYLGELAYSVSPDAAGVFQIDFIDPGMPEGTRLIDASGNHIEFTAEQTIIEIVCPYGDADNSGRVDLDDILCVVDGYSGASQCLQSQLDIYPCEGDGDVDLDDVIAVLDAFTGNPPCEKICRPL